MFGVQVGNGSGVVVQSKISLSPQAIEDGQQSDMFLSHIGCVPGGTPRRGAREPGDLSGFPDGAQAYRAKRRSLASRRLSLCLSALEAFPSELSKSSPLVPSSLN